MKGRRGILLAGALLVMAGGVGALAFLRTHQHLGAPGVKTRPIAGKSNLEVVLPETVLDYTSEAIEQPETVIKNLPADTSYGSRRYQSPDGFFSQASVVLMGADRTSHHKPQYCLPGSGWKIDQTERDQIHIDRPVPYDLPVIRITVTRQFDKDGQTVTVRGVYVYWYVADGALSGDPSGFEKMWSLAKTLVTTGVLQRWAYVSFFSPCAPGEEKNAFERMKKLIVAAVPEFQLTPGAKSAVVAR